MTDSGRGRGGIETDAGRTDRAVATVRSIALVALVATAAIIAGCGALPGGGGGDDGVQQNIDAPREVSDPMDPSADEVFSRVTEIMGVEAEAPGVRATNLPTNRNFSNPFLNAVVGLPDDPGRLSGPNNASIDPEENTILFNEESVYDLNGSEVEYYMAYYSALAIHYQQDWIDAESDSMGENAVLRGTTQAVVREYADEYMDLDVSVDGFEEDRAYEWAAYDVLNYYGTEYVDSRIDAASDVPSVYEDGVPETTEQLLHDTDEGAGDLSVTVDATNWWLEAPMPLGEATLGELRTRAILRSQFSAEEAAAAADGWSNDTGTTITSVRNESMGTVWAHQWDSEAEADEFADAAEALADARQSSANVTTNVTRPAPDTTVLVAHRGNFRNNAEITYEDSTVTVAVGKSS